jgi:hypothetical protein
MVVMVVGAEAERLYHSGYCEREFKVWTKSVDDDGKWTGGEAEGQVQQG